MRSASLVFIGAVVSSLAFAWPAAAKNSNSSSHADANAQKLDEEAATQGCRAYQQGPDGSWVQLSCHEGGEGAAAPSRGTSASRATGEIGH
jgi:hypothetical protein